MKYPKYKVVVDCMTYNQSKYITDAMNGFTMQQTTFPFVCTIVDDASTDGEQEVIRKYVEQNFDFSEGSMAYHKETDYAHITYAQHKTNKNCYFAVLYLKENHYSQKKDKSPYLKEWRDGVEYLAICEGDDYWIVPDKLQMQNDFLDQHDNYGLVHTKFQSIPTRRLNTKVPVNPQDDYLVDILEQRYKIGTLTVMYKLSVYNKLPHLDKGRGYMMGDYQMWIEFSRFSKIKYIAKGTAIYRVCSDSASHSRDLHKEILFLRNLVECSEFYAQQFHIKLVSYKTVFYNESIKRAFIRNEKIMVKELYDEAKNNKSLSIKSRFFFLCSYLPFMRFLIMLLYKLTI